MSAALKSSPSDGAMYYVRETEAVGGVFEELARVTLLSDAETLDGAKLPAGTTGTIVGVWGKGERYDVEFVDPPGALVTVGPGALRAA